MPGREEHELHVRIVEGQIASYEREGTKVIAADFGDWPKPPRVGRRVPDIVVERIGQRIINECETCRTVGTDQTRQ